MSELECKAESFDLMFFLLVSISQRELNIGWAVKPGRVRRVTQAGPGG